MTSSLAHYSSDFAVASQGVIADVRNGVEERSDGCVRKPGCLCQSPHQPLQWCLEALSIFLNRSANIYPTVQSADQTAQAGITDDLPWHSLYFHYNAYKGQMPAPVATTGSPNVAPTSSGNPSKMPNVLSPRAYGVKLGGIPIKLGGILPQPIALRVDMAISSCNANLGGEVANWRLRLHWFPQLVSV